MADFSPMTDRPPYGRKTDWFKCARCRKWFPVAEQMHGCYQRTAALREAPMKDDTALRTLARLSDEMGEEL